MNWTFSSSPTLYDGKLYLQVLQRDRPARGHGRADGPIDSVLMVLDPATGTNLARVVRPTDALDESHDAYSTPIPFEFQGQRQILVGGGNYVTGHELGTGRELWRSPDLNPRQGRNWRVVTSPVASGGIILACQPQNNTIRALRPQGGGAPAGAALVWSEEEHREIATDVPTPAVADGDFFVLGDASKTLSRLEAATGKIKWQTALPGSAHLSSVAHGGGWPDLPDEFCGGCGAGGRGRRRGAEYHRHGRGGGRPDALHHRGIQRGAFYPHQSPSLLHREAITSVEQFVSVCCSISAPIRWEGRGSG